MIIWIIGILFILFGFLVAIAGVIRQVTNFYNQKKANKQWSSPVPIVGSMFFFTGYMTLPIEHSPWSLLFLILDIDTSLVVLGFPYILYYNYKSKKTHDKK